MADRLRNANRNRNAPPRSPLDSRLSPLDSRLSPLTSHLSPPKKDAPDGETVGSVESRPGVKFDAKGGRAEAMESSLASKCPQSPTSVAYHFECGTAQVGAQQVGTAQVGSQLGTAHVGAQHVGTAQVGALQVTGALQLTSTAQQTGSWQS
ncbi:hypothetical protein Pan189_22820 [Stratiformator vulcanicus]|uniref:Uncharacterized protein n=1 Tax=Stratiformator vulcanicus TaxID=2527980 RepID=A0A517R1Z1_9PLAN|nr:hypothetical protein Pan189_22820 [Stratiformator vulcanicus]